MTDGAHRYPDEGQPPGGLVDEQETSPPPVTKVPFTKATFATDYPTLTGELVAAGAPVLPNGWRYVIHRNKQLQSTTVLARDGAVSVGWSAPTMFQLAADDPRTIELAHQAEAHARQRVATDKRLVLAEPTSGFGPNTHVIKERDTWGGRLLAVVGLVVLLMLIASIVIPLSMGHDWGWFADHDMCLEWSQANPASEANGWADTYETCMKSEGREP